MSGQDTAEDLLCEPEFVIEVCGVCALVHVLIDEVEVRIPGNTARKIAAGLIQAAELADAEALGEVVEAT